jgi:antibiotic biosynthesis monooxygenase (ABM) superfamily enzyme
MAAPNKCASPPASDRDIGLEIVPPDSRATAIVVQRVPEEKIPQFLEWQRGATAAAQSFPGYERTEIFPPGAGGRNEWVALLHFTSKPALDAWLASPLRKERIDRLRRELGDFELRQFQGLGDWFRSADDRGGPPGWKMALVVVFGLYPTVMLLAIALAPVLAPLPFAVRMLLSNVLSVCILQWGVMPILSRCLGRWLSPRPHLSTGTSLLIFLGILLGLGGMVAFFTPFAPLQ